ncbi:DUF4913 domain-containing protein [uncultured Rothia sp.]|uniref:DUF4913 domain-containing protein n=1 Tax=uncultured Rothia sp. TaxID=316088 RepID=UPI00261BC78B|nr:DUF4913 domain-containing protein [uncultured Rothia sp.]
MSYGFDDDVMPMTAPIPVVSEQHDFLAERVKALEALSDQLLDVLDALRDRVEQLESAGPVPAAVDGEYEVQDVAAAEPATYVPYCWRHVSAAEARGLWVRLREWVDWVNGRYFASSWESIRPCWFRHPAAVEELTALWAAWESAYRAPDEGEGFSDAALWWHEKLHAVVHRLWDEQFAECKAGHQDPDVYERSTDPSFEEFLQGR